MNNQEWRSQPSSKRFKLALSTNDVERWTIIPTLRPQSVAEHSFNVAIIADAFCEELELGRGSSIRMETMRWALWHDADEIFTGDMPTPVKMQIPKYVMDEICELSGVDTHLEECGNTLSKQLVKLADMVEACRFLNTWGVAPSRDAIVSAIKSRIRIMIEANTTLSDVAVMASDMIKGGDISWWMEGLQPSRLVKRNKKESSEGTSQIMIHIPDLSSRLKTTLPTQCGQTSSQTLTPKERKGRRGSKK